MAKYFAPLLQKGGGGFGRQPAERAKQHTGIIVNITAKVGSIGDNGSSIIIRTYCVILWMLFANVIVPCSGSNSSTLETMPHLHRGDDVECNGSPAKRCRLRRRTESIRRSRPRK
ncbi:unnamed protein product [Tetraodon nigroviridis]|uniref:(spotted green pufferfish) hypothetical protein n=1 Tax=Tetraodon nigroviridis TaxID=99883 RepID=Q4SQN9_TETNG|nr:unnamed protein product [Tetraodon nigroviridis]